MSGLNSFWSFVYSHYVLLIILFCLVIALASTFSLMPKRKWLFTLLITVMLIASLVLEEVDHYFYTLKSLDPGNMDYYVKVRLVLSFLKFITYPLIVLFAIYMFEEHKSIMIILAAVEVLNILVYSSCFYSGFAFTISSDGEMVAGRMYWLVFLVCTLYYIYLIVVFVMKHKNSGMQLLVAFITIMIFIILSVVFTYLDRSTNYLYNLNTTIAGSVLSYYLCYSSISTKDSVSIQKKELKDKQNELLISQIKPHFIYETLGTISKLCDEDKEEAKKTIANFSKYLRVNLDLKNQLINFADEVKHCQNYTDIAMNKYKNIHVEYNINDVGFKVPPLSIQPLVESSIKNNFENIENGKILIQSFVNLDGNHLIEIKDNGNGINEMKLIEEDDESQIGLTNIRNRISDMCNGTVEVQSSEKGTTIIIIIPSDENLGKGRKK